MKTLLALLIGTAALIASSISASHAQMWGMMDGCREGYVYNAKRDVCVPTKRAKKVHRKKRGTSM